jgi:hypothetical protein
VNREGEMAAYLKAARWFPIGIDAFADIRQVMYDGIAAEFAARAAREEGVEIP